MRDNNRAGMLHGKGVGEGGKICTSAGRDRSYGGCRAG